MPARSRRTYALAIRLFAVLVATLVLLEGTARLLLFSDLASGWSLARRFREPARYTRNEAEDLYWGLNALWMGPEKRQLGFPYDPRVGWTSWDFLPRTYEHDGEAGVARTREVLLFGDSFSACMTPAAGCFQTLADASYLHGYYTLLNYGVVGHGLDQIALVEEGAVARHAADDPIVIVGLLVDNDLERTVLSYRDWPKPRFRVSDGALVLPDVPVPTVDQAIEQVLPGPTSWALRLLRSFVPGDRSRYPPRTQEEMERISRLLLRRIVTDLQARDLSFFFVLFHSPADSVPGRADDWRDELVKSELTALDAPWVVVRDDLRLAAEHEQRSTGSYFLPPDSPGRGHLSAQGNGVAWESMLRGLRSFCDVPEPDRLPPAPWIFESHSGSDGTGLSLYQFGPSPYLPEGYDRDRLVLRPAGDGPTRVRYSLKGRVRELRARVSVGPPRPGMGGVEVRIDVDGERRWSRSLEVADGSQPLRIDLSGAEELSIEVRALDAGSDRGNLLLSDPEFELEAEQDR